MYQVSKFIINQISFRITTRYKNFCKWNFFYICKKRWRIYCVKKYIFYSSYNLETGSHILEIDSLNFNFPPLRLDVNSKGKMRIIVNDGYQTELNVPLVIAPISEQSYFHVIFY